MRGAAAGRVSEAGRAAKDVPGGLKFTGQIHFTIDYRTKTIYNRYKRKHLMKRDAYDCLSNLWVSKPPQERDRRNEFHRRPLLRNAAERKDNDETQENCQPPSQHTSLGLFVVASACF